MRQSKFISARVAPNCYKTVAVDKGIIQYYSVCVGNTVDLNMVRNGYAVYTYYDRFRDDETHSNISIYRIVETSTTFRRIPYKQCYPKLYTQEFKFILFRVFTSWYDVAGRGGLDETFKFNSTLVREFVLDLKKETQYYK
jgi:hypothetical protein